MYLKQAVAILFIIIKVCVTPCMPDIYRGQRKAFDPLKLELTVVVSYHIVLGLKLKSPGKKQPVL